ncbi:c-type cytochrome [Rhodoferax sp. UBA5149]|uniref:c-type cytochrome n=1 Tax=Rhodoferax sp. UBA5149 TaxID=1947379 RepID=UPI0025EB1116|nr:c-type cytochrome [Rhodoferax sp. UBA5149]
MKLLASYLFAAALVAPAFSTLAQETQPAAPHAEAKAEPVKAVKPDLAKGEASFAAVCAACHAPDGNSLIPVNPKLAQQHPEYLVKQLQDFKSGKRVNPIMSAMAATLSDEDVKNVAYWLTSKTGKPGFAKDKELVTLGERIYRGGIADRQIAACAGCHSPNGAGIPSQFPRLSGQHADYAVAQLTNFRDGVRKNSVQMTQIAAKMNDREIRAVADYIAGLR